MGSAKAYIQRGMQRDAKEVNWDVDYNGDNADIDLDINNNGEKQHYDIQLDNDEIKNLLNVHSIDKPLEDRLLEDYLSNNNNTINDVNASKLISYKMPTSVSRSASRKSSKSSKKTSSKRLKTNISRLRTSVSHSRGSLNKSKRSKSRSSRR